MLPAMRDPLIDAAQALHAALKESFARHPGGAADPEALRRIGRLCAAARLTLNDPECRAPIFLRARILRELARFQARTPPPLSGRAADPDRPVL
jgi:hypothetical protein